MPIREEAAAEADDDDEYEDMDDGEDTVTQPLRSMNYQAMTVDDNVAGDLSMIMEHSFIDQDLCLSGMLFHHCHHHSKV